jgi:hypothetical protein
VRTSSAA